GEWIYFHERHVLERRGVEDRVGAMFFQEFIEQNFVRNVAKNRNVRGRTTRAQFAVNFVEILLGMVEKQNERCAGTNDVPGEARADAAAGAGDEHDLAR